MKISTKGRYALRLMLDLSMRSDSDYVALKDISARQEISVKYLEQIVMQLTRSGLVRSARGPQGGYRLTREPQSYTVGEILRTIEGSLAPVACLDDEVNQCKRAPHCTTLRLWETLYKSITEVVDSVTLLDLLEDGGREEFLGLLEEHPRAC